MLRVDPRQRHRPAEIITSLRERITEARANGWLGEVQGLQTSLEAVSTAKLTSLVRAEQIPKSGTADLGLPVIRRT